MSKDLENGEIPLDSLGGFSVIPRVLLRQTWVRVRGDVAMKAEVRERKERGTQPAVADSEDGGRNPADAQNLPQRNPFWNSDLQSWKNKFLLL